MRIGLIAMSGTPIRDGGIVDIVRQSASLQARLSAVASLPSLGLLTVASIIGNQAEVDYLQCRDASSWDKLPGPFDLVGISTFSAQIDEAYQLAQRYTAAGTPVVIGGTHASVLPDDITSRGFIAAVGEAELIWKNIVADAKAGRLKPCYGELGKLCDITQSPVPAFDLLDPNEFKRLPVQTSRGCPHRCEFCAASVLISPRYRQKTIRQVLNEIDSILRIWKRPFIEFVDDNALVDKTYWKELLTEIAKRKIRWFAECDISVGNDVELLDLMHASGCREVLIGLESPAARETCGIELNSNWKSKSHKLYFNNIANIQNRGIRVIGCFMLGLDNQTRESAEMIREFINDTELFDVQVTLQTAFPGTPLYRRLEKEGRLKSNDYRDTTLFDLNIVPKSMSATETVNSFRDLLACVHSKTEVDQRRRAFNNKLRSNKSKEKDHELSR